MIESMLAKAQNALQEGDIPTAINIANSAVNLEPENTHTLSFLAYIYADARDFDNARSTFKKIISIDSNNTSAQTDLGRLLIYNGHFEEARNHLKAAASVEPNDPASYFYLTQICDTKDAPELIDTLKKINTPHLDPVRQAMTGFALGKLYDITGNYDLAFEAFEQANRVAKPEYDHSTTVKFYDALKSTFTQNALQTGKENGHPSTRPIFIVGMPRCGSSLVEELLARNSDVKGLGERDDIAKTVGAIARNHPVGYPGGIHQMNAEQFRGFADICLNQYDRQANGALHFIDKSLANFQHLGFIGKLFPNSKIIHLKRDPIATCFSAFHQLLHNDPYSFDLTNLANRYAAYQNLMAHWADAASNDFINQDYEALIRDSASAMNALSEKLTINVQSNTNQPADRDIATSSAWQARQPVYDHAITHWKKYEKHLGPLINALENAGVTI